MANWSSGQDVALSRRRQGFDSPTSYSVIYVLLKEWAVMSTLSLIYGYNLHILNIVYRNDIIHNINFIRKAMNEWAGKKAMKQKLSN